ncbi:hypothetical protein JXM67_04895 [candidate division WOR-3 bacterium]|nr:hypothetical protein [candidate division WOR-3 bacterium]
MVRNALIVNAIVFLLSTSTVDAGWSRTYGGEGYDWGKCVEQTSDGGYIITGLSATYGIIYERFWVIRTDANGDTLWTDILCAGCGECVQQTNDDGYIAVGVIQEYTEFVDSNIWLLKFNSLGDTVWTRTYGGDTIDYAKEVRQTSDGGYIIVGNTYSFGAGWTDVWLLKTDSLGDTLWTRIYGSSEIDLGLWVEETSDGGYIVAGTTGYSFTMGWVIKFNADGELQWENSQMRHFMTVCTCVKEVSGDKLVVAGCDQNMPVLVGLDKEGYPEWVNYYGENGERYLVAMDKTNDGGFIVTGRNGLNRWDESNIWLTKTDSIGNKEWTRIFGGEGYDQGCYVRQTDDGGYIIVGEKDTTYGDLWLIKTDSLVYVAVKEEPLVTPVSDYEVISSVGSEVVLRFADCPQGFHAVIFDASGRMVDEIHPNQQSGTITWGEDYGPGVYFINPKSNDRASALKVVLNK